MKRSEIALRCLTHRQRRARTEYLGPNRLPVEKLGGKKAVVGPYS